MSRQARQKGTQNYPTFLVLASSILGRCRGSHTFSWLPRAPDAAEGFGWCPGATWPSTLENRTALDGLTRLVRSAQALAYKP